MGSVLLPIGDPRNYENERAVLRNWANHLAGREPEVFQPPTHDAEKAHGDHVYVKN